VVLSSLHPLYKLVGMETLNSMTTAELCEWISEEVVYLEVAKAFRGKFELMDYINGLGTYQHPS